MSLVPMSPNGNPVYPNGSMAEFDLLARKHFELTDSMLKLLYLIGKYARCAENIGDNESWIREVHLSVLIYEGIVSEVLDYDYAPQSVLVGTKRVWMNVSQEGRDDIDDLREAGMINALKMATEDLTAATAFQVSKEGMDVLKAMAQALMDAVDFFLFPPRPFPKETKSVKWDMDNGTFAVFTKKGYHVWSHVTTIEDVSYVSSPYLLDCLRKDMRP